MGKRNANKQPRRVSVTDLADLGRCERQAMYRFHGQPEQVDAVVAAARRRGKAEHERRHRELTNSRGHRRGPCFIATAVYGGNAWQTELLRDYRDDTLLLRWWGRLAVKVYYRVSPRIAMTLAARPSAARAVKLLLDRFVVLLMRHY